MGHKAVFIISFISLDVLKDICSESLITLARGVNVCVREMNVCVCVHLCVCVSSYSSSKMGYYSTNLKSLFHIRRLYFVLGLVNIGEGLLAH